MNLLVLSRAPAGFEPFESRHQCFDFNLRQVTQCMEPGTHDLTLRGGRACFQTLFLYLCDSAKA